MQKFMFFICLVFSLSAGAADLLPKPESTQIASGLSEQQANELLTVARHYYAFWNTGEEHFAKSALSKNFVDLNLPEGRPQGPEGPLLASAGFRKAVPDLSMDVKSVYVLTGKVIAHLEFKGHFTGVFGETKGKGQAISFAAVDMYTIKNGKITENWHLEDNQTLMQQLGM